MRGLIPGSEFGGAEGDRTPDLPSLNRRLRLWLSSRTGEISCAARQKRSSEFGFDSRVLNQVPARPERRHEFSLAWEGQ